MAFLPISDVEEHPLATPFVTYALIVLNVAVYFLVQPKLTAVSEVSQITPQIASFYDTYAVVPSELAKGQDLSTVMTAMFLHGSVAHLLSNMLYLWIFGNNVEHALGHLKFTAFYLISGVAATALQVILFPASDVWNLGASGAIAGVLGAYLLLFPRAKINVFVWPWGMTRITALLVIGLWFVLQLLSGGSQLGQAGDEGGIAYWSHVGGFVAGAVMAIGLRFIGATRSAQHHLS